MSRETQVRCAEVLGLDETYLETVPLTLFSWITSWTSRADTAWSACSASKSPSSGIAVWSSSVRMTLGDFHSSSIRIRFFKPARSYVVTASIEVTLSILFWYRYLRDA